MIDTLAFRIPRHAFDEILGTIAAYRLSEDFGRAWADLAGASGSAPRYSTLTTALCAFGNRPAGMFVDWDLTVEGAPPRRRMLLAAERPFDYRLPAAMRVWEERLRGGRGPGRLADLLPPAEHDVPLGAFIRARDGAVPQAPPWVFRTAAWHVARLLAAQPLAIGGSRSLSLRTDTQGRLLAWDPADLIGDTEGGDFGMATISIGLVTRAGIDDPVLCFDAHLSRLSRKGIARHIWIDRGADAPILRLPLRHKRNQARDWTNYLDEEVPEIIAVAELAPLKLPGTWPLCWDSKPGGYRPQATNKGYNSLGSGLGPRFMQRLHEHIVEALPGLEPLGYAHDKAIKLMPRQVKYPPEGFSSRDIRTSGYDRLTLACVYQTAEAHARMMAEIRKLTGADIHVEPGAGPVAVNEALEVVACHSPALLAHGTRNRAGIWQSLGLRTSRERLVAAWLETEFPRAPEDRASDAKPHLRRLLGHLQVCTQFLATEPLTLPNGVRPRTPEAKAHAARAALRDLFRSAGALDPRLSSAVFGPRLRLRPERRVKLVGLHLRRQQTRSSGAETVLTAVALIIDPANPDAWRLLMYDEHERSWTRMAPGLAAFHAGPIGESHFGTPEEVRERARERADARLAVLAEWGGGDEPIVVFANAQAARNVWPGLQNNHFGRGPLPGDELIARGLDIAVVRVNSAVGEIGRPVSRTDQAARPKDPAQPAAPGQKVYRLLESNCASWYLPGRSVRSNARFGDVASRHTRWSVPEGRTLEKPWDAFTAAEIAVVRAGGWQADELAALCARLSDQPVAWDGRTNSPVPLHIAVIADQDHPDYRTDEDGDSD